MKKVHIIFLMAAALLPFITRATEQTDNSDPVIVDSLATIVEENDPAISVAGTIPVHVTDTVSSADISAQLEERVPCCFLVTPSTYRKYHGPDFQFFKNTTNYSIEPYTFMQDQTWVGVPVFLA